MRDQPPVRRPVSKAGAAAPHDDAVIDLRELEEGANGEGWRVLRALNEQYDRDPSTKPTVEQLAAALRTLSDSEG